MYKKTLLLLLSILLFSFSDAQAQGITFVKGTFDEILSLAQKDDKLVFIDAYTTWCGPCKAMTQRVFPQENVGTFFNKNFVSAKIDMEKGEGKVIGLRYNIRSYPTMLFVDSEGTLVYKVAGYQSSKKLIEQGKKAIDPSFSLAAMEERFKIGDRNPSFLLKYMTLRYNMGDNSHGPIAEAYLKTQEDWTSPNAMQTIYKYTTSTDSEMFTFMATHKKLFYQKFGSSKVGRRIQLLIEKKLADEKTTLEEVQNVYRKVYSGEKGEEMASKIAMTFYRRKGDRKKYAEATFAHFKKYPSKNAADLNEVGQTFYSAVSNKKNLKKMVKLMKHAVKMDNTSEYNLTLAELYFKLKKRRKAQKTANSALALAKAMDDDDIFEEADELLRKIEKM